SLHTYLTVDSGNPRRVKWSVPQHLGVFAGMLFRPYQDVDLFMSIDVTMERFGVLTNAKRVFSSSATATPGFACQPKIQLSYSCLAKGTQVRLADGKSAAIETITPGSKVVTDNSGLALGVSDTSVGIERIPMVHLKDDAGHDLLLTVSHPVVTPDRGVVWAEELAVGDKVYTEGGVSSLVKADREMFDGTVHNLKLDTSGLKQSRFARGSTLYANGFMVGDLSMQHAYEFKDSAANTAKLLARLPARWHADYQNSLKQGTLSARR
ncbi:MAG TPA: Hint domain-containing protein, partial [Archangium sp.]|nr:Hint domain-containing protein [Archangium sp.]